MIASCLGRSACCQSVIPDLLWRSVGKSPELSRKDSVPFLGLRVLEQHRACSLKFCVGFTHHFKLLCQALLVLLPAQATDQIPGSFNGLMAGLVFGGQADWRSWWCIEENPLYEIVSGVAVEGGGTALLWTRTHDTTAGSDSRTKERRRHDKGRIRVGRLASWVERADQKLRCLQYVLR